MPSAIRRPGAGAGLISRRFSILPVAAKARIPHLWYSASEAPEGPIRQLT